MNKKLLRIIVALMATGLATCIQANPVSALPNQGPDPNLFSESYYYGNSYPGVARTVDYAVATSAYNTILTNTINIYMPAPTGTITVNNVNICYGTFKNGGRNYDQLDDGVINSSGNAVSYRIGGNTQWGAFDGSGSCDSVSRSFAVSGASLDPSTNLYKYQLFVTANPAIDKYTNSYWVVAPSGAYISQDSSSPTSALGMQQTSPIPPGNNPTSTTDPPNPYKDYTNYVVIFAPDCTFVGPTATKTIEMYDDDNVGNIDVQPKEFIMKLYETDIVSGATVEVPLSATFPDGGGSSFGPSAGGYYVFSTTGNNKRTLISFTLKTGKRYAWSVESVYYDNTLQFKMPYDSVYYYTGCAASAAKLKAGMTAVPGTMSQDDTTTFTPSIIVSSYTSPVTVNCSITRMFYPVSGGSSSLGSQPCVTTSGNANIPVSGNGTISLRGNTYSSPSTAVPGSRICDTITITSPSGSSYFTVASDNTSTSCVTITKTPYVHFTGGDVWAGGGFAAIAPGTCNNAAKITTAPASAALSDSTFAGSGTAYGAFALDKITNFGSASFALTASTGDNWTFSNINTSNLGFFGAPQHCITDYVSTYQSAPTLAPGTYALDGPSAALWHVTGDATFYGSPVVAGVRKVFLVDGDITISGNIAYPASFSSGAGLPSVVLIAKGNIYVSPGVTQMDGIYISRGTFYTCWPKTDPATISTCNNQLTVNGSVSATALDLFRTAGSDGGTPATRKAPAENFNLSPEVYITNALNSTSSQTITTSNVRELSPRF